MRRRHGDDIIAQRVSRREVASWLAVVRFARWAEAIGLNDCNGSELRRSLDRQGSANSCRSLLRFNLTFDRHPRTSAHNGRLPREGNE